MSNSVLPYDREHDVVVIGSGPGGEGAAMKSAKSGQSVVIVERHRQVGGGCTHWATIPSKALRQSVQTVMEFRKSQLFAGINDRVRFTFPQLLRAAESVIAKQVSMRRDFYLRNHVTVAHGHARFIDEHTIEVEEGGGLRRKIHGKRFIIATGTRPYRPPNVDFNHPRIHDSDTVLSLDHTPDSLTIYGAGVIGCEYASIFRNLGVKVNLINSRDKLLSFLDDEIIDALSYHLRDRGVVLRHNEEYERVEPVDDGVIVHLKSGKKIKSEIVLWAQGRTGNTDDMGLELLDIAPNSRGQLDIDDRFHVQGKEHIYAVGDVVGYPGLASASYDQGRFAASHILDPESGQRLVEDIPTGIYTTPEISSVGRTERELTADGVPYEVGHALFRSLARAQITGNTVGMLKLLFHRETLQLLGIHCFGDQAAEIVHIGQAIMAQPGEANSVEYFVQTTFNYPTMAEAYRVAALNGLNRLC
ncbi:MAG TPA: Si-specific NAD(P)(+) transhydrogenase [Sandaracinaceae bacterium LLY-WYZ-13_1]|nr:Si-specific NAD(P)(+) transhydrogenase [Sandaracinaceae bacterium LLY-WYZ-13_1]